MIKNLKPREILLIKILAVLIIIFSALYLIKYQKDKIVSENKLPDLLLSENELATSTTEWKSYENTIYGFSLKYPPELELSIIRNGACFNDQQVDFCIENLSNQENKSLEDFLKSTELYGYYNYDDDSESKNRIKFLNYDALYFGYENSPNLLIKRGTDVVAITGREIPEEIFSTITFQEPKLSIPPYKLEISWNSEQIKEDGFFGEAPIRSCLVGDAYKIGSVKNGFFAGDAIVGSERLFCGMDCGGRSETELDYYVRHGDLNIPVGSDTHFVVEDIDLPNIINVPNSRYVLKKDFAASWFTKNRINSVLFTDPIVGPIYDDSYGKCIVAERKDHALVYYSLDLPFVNKENGQIDLTLTNGNKFNESYDVDSDWSCLNVVKDPFTEHQLHVIGYNNLSEPFYALEGADAKLKDLYEDPNTIAKYNNKVLSYEEYLAVNPILYWKDPFGRWIEFLNKNYLRAAEKCKPVIYLYPTKTMDVNVYVNPNGGFTHTIPEYNKGWHVTASPDGNIFDKGSKNNYQYLYWAGWSYDAPKITKGWVVGINEIENFLKVKLSLLGLNNKEIADFNEYWVGRLKAEGAPYYKIMFLDQEEFNKLAPLRVEGEEKPNQIIRVVMYAEPTRGKEKLPPQILPETPKREGFTVVEWGGSLLK